MNVNPFSYLIEKLKSKADKGESAPPTDDNIPTNADLNNYTTVGFYHCGGGNTVANKPTGVGAFGLIVIHSAGGAYYEQRLTDSYSKKSYVRYGVSGTWGSWNELALDKGSVSVTADGVKTYKQLFNELKNLIDFSKVGVTTKLSLDTTYFTISYNGGANAIFSQVDISSQLPSIVRMNISSNSSLTTYQNNSYADISNNVLSSGKKIVLYY